ncbi:MAG: PepSY domain-containing protein [Burkholderiaceae bacterium]|mgnify:CR=1 FL=1|nr:PepSY domain-containing protein [Burkholderiaceae bacterium]
MKSDVRLRQGLLLLSLGLAALSATAGDECDAPLHRWQSREAVRQMAAAQGWQIQRLKIDDGCYEVRGTDAQGRRFKATIDPETLKVLKRRQDDHRRDRDHGRGADESAPQPVRPPPADGATSSSPLPTPGGAPRGQIG